MIERSRVSRARLLAATTVLLSTTLAGITTAAPAHAVMQPGNEIVQFGDNTYGQTGDGTPLGARWTQISGGGFHTLALRNDGTVWAWGWNAVGQLGNNTTTNSSTPVQVTGPGGTGFLTRITQISAGGTHTLALRNDGTVWAWGYNAYGQLGNNTATTGATTTPVQVKGPGGIGFLTGITQISAGDSHSIARRSDGTVWAWGNNSFGELGNNTATNSATTTPVQVLGFGGAGFLTGITQISAGYRHSLARSSDGTVWAWGYNGYGQLGINNSYTNSSVPALVVGPGGIGFLTGITQISAGFRHSLARKSDGTVWAWGDNASGELGDNTTTNSPTPVQVLGVGGKAFLSGITQISGGDGHSLARKSDGTVWAWGYNLYGQLGDGTLTQRNTPVQVVGVTRAVAINAGDYHTEILRTPSLSANPATIAFGTVRTNSTTTSTPVTITNNDTVTVIVNGVTPTGTDATAFDPNGPSLPATLAPGQSITLTVTATTDATARIYTAQLQLDTDQPEPFIIPITLKAVDPTWTLGPVPSDFGRIAVGTTSTTQAVLVTNTGLVRIGTIAPTIIGINPADFVVVATSCTGTLDPGQSCSVDVSARPTAVGLRVATLRVASDAGVRSVSLSATGANPADLGISVSGPGTGTAATPFADTITVVNYGPSLAKNVTVSVTLSAGGSFTSLSGTGWSCTGAGLTKTCTRLSLASGASAPITANVSFPAGAQSLTATITGASTVDPDPTDNTTLRSTTVS